jgi:hypothetical protein
VVKDGNKHRRRQTDINDDEYCDLLLRHRLLPRISGAADGEQFQQTVR